MILAGVGLAYGGFNKAAKDKEEQKLYVHLSFESPNQAMIMTIVKRTPKSECEEWRNDYFQANQENCKGCKVIHNECTDTISERYIRALDNKDIGTAYILKPYSYPEIIVIDGLPEEHFEQACNIHKKSLESTICRL